LKVLNVNDVRQIGIHTAEPLLRDPSCFEVEIAIKKLKTHTHTHIYISPGIEQILAELIQAGGNTLCSAIHKLVNSLWKKEDMPQQ
jgi:hypothetical protein